MQFERRVVDPVKQCKVCGVKFTKPSHYSYTQWVKRTYCSLSCRGKDLKPDTFTRWKGGQTFIDGYWYEYSPSHPRARKNIVKRSILVLEKKLQRYLYENEIAHHLNGIKDDDDPNNLVAMDNRDHSKYHAVARGLGKDKKGYRIRDQLGRFMGGSINEI